MDVHFWAVAASMDSHAGEPGSVMSPGPISSGSARATVGSMPSTPPSSSGPMSSALVTGSATPASLDTSMPKRFAAARILGMALSPNSDCGALDRAFLVCAAS